MNSTELYLPIMFWVFAIGTVGPAVAILFGLGAWLLYQLRRGYEEQLEAGTAS